jgi:hypothetical protein
MLVCDLLDYQSSSRSFSPEAADCHSAARESVFDRVGKSQRFVRMNVVIRSNQFRFL